VNEKNRKTSERRRRRPTLKLEADEPKLSTRDQAVVTKTTRGIGSN